MVETEREYMAVAKKVSNQAKGSVVDWFIRRDGFTSYNIDDFYVTWIAKVGKHFKAHVEFRNVSGKTCNMAFDVDIFDNGERVITAYEIVGVTVYNISNVRPTLIGFDDSLV